MYELDGFRVTHASKYAASVLSVGLSPNCALLAVGLTDGQLLVRKHSHNKGPAAATPGDRTVPARCRILCSMALSSAGICMRLRGEQWLARRPNELPGGQ